MKKFIFILATVVVIIGSGLAMTWVANYITKDSEYVNSKSDLIKPDIEPNTIISSPLVISGEARGYWYFEGSFPVTLEDADGNVLVQHYATALGEWMIEDFVPFESTLIFSLPSTSTGNLILHKDNPSGLPENDDQLVIPIVF